MPEQNIILKLASLKRFFSLDSRRNHRSISAIMADEYVLSNISLADSAGANPGNFRVHCGGITWKKKGGGKNVDIDKSDIVGITWMRIPRSYQLGVQTKDGPFYKFIGFNDQDVNNLKFFVQNNFGRTAEEKQLSLSGHTWGDVDLCGNILTFLVGSKQAFDLSLADVSQKQLQGKNDVKFEFPANVTNNENDLLEEIVFHIPDSNTEYGGDEVRSPAQVFHDKVKSMADVGVSGKDAVVTFESISILTPRGRYTIELHLSFFRLHGQAMDFKIQYSSVHRIYVLPKCNQTHQTHTFVVITLYPPIRRGQTSYPHIVLQFESELVFETTLSISEDLLNTRYKNKLEREYKEFIPEVFTKTLNGLAGAKVTRSGRFRSHHQLNAVNSSLKTEDGLLYPLEMGFFFLPKTPTFIEYTEINYVEFKRYGAGGINIYFDLVIILKNRQEHVFANIQKIEYEKLHAFIREKNLNIRNLGGGPTTGAVAIALQNDDDDADEEDDDFVMEKDDSGSPTDDSGGEQSDASLSGGEEEKPPKEASTLKPSSSKKRSRGGDGDGSKKRKPRKKKDPNAPKKAMSGFMFFSKSERDNIMRSNPGIAFTDVARALGEKWRNMTGAEKEPFEAMAQADQKRYKQAMAGYTSAPMAIDSGNASDN